MKSIGLSSIIALCYLWPVFGSKLSCDEGIGPLERCPSPPLVGDVIKRSMLTNYADIKEKCMRAQEARDCRVSYISRCFTNPPSSVYKDLIGSLEHFLVNFCNEKSPLSKEYYQRYSNCYYRFSPESFQRCNQVNVALRQFELYRFTKKDAKKTICCSFSHDSECYQEVIRTRCPKDDARFMDGLFARLSGSFHPQISCEKYFGRGSKAYKCRGRYSNPASVPTYNWLFNLLIFVSMLL